ITVTGGDARSVFNPDREILELEGGESAELEIEFKPVRRGPFTSYLELRYCQDCPISRIELTGHGGVDQIRVSTIDFGTLSPGRELTRNLNIENDGDFPVTISKAELGDAHPDFALVDPRAVEIEPGFSATYQVAFRAGEETGPREGKVRFFDGKGELRPEEAFLLGRSGGIEIVVAPEGADFGRQPVNVTARKPIVLKNVGEQKTVYLMNPSFNGSQKFTYKEMIPRLPEGVEGAGGWKVDEMGPPVPFEIVFADSVEAEHYGTLTFQVMTPDGNVSSEQPEVIVPLMGQTVEPQPCSLDVNPPEIRFGAVRASRTYNREIAVTNVGTDECFLWDIELQEITSRRYFSLAKEIDEPTMVLAPGEALEVRVIYNPKVAQTSASARADEAFFVFSHPGEQGRIRITGLGTNLHIVPHPNPITFGTVKLMARQPRDFTLSNMGASTAAISRIAVAGGSDADPTFGVSVDGAMPVIEPGGVTAPGLLSAWFKPLDPGTRASELEVWVNGVSEPVFVDLQGVGSTEECDVECQAPVVTCPPKMTEMVNTQVTINGSAFSPGGHDMTCQWRVISGGGSQQPPPGRGVKPTFTPALVGDYTLELKCTDANDNWSTCQTELTATPWGGLWIETYWDRSGDIDLHVLNEDMADPWNQASWSTNADCFWANKTPIWDPGLPNASPALDRDDIPGTGPENIRISSPAPHRYAIGIHNFNNRSVPVEVTTNVYCGGSLITSELTTVNANRDFHIIGLVDDLCLWTPDNTLWHNF
ncbi:MAG TPA: choice-of-anchor D domain-containing protein, partial [Vulgatibacter sp.]